MPGLRLEPLAASLILSSLLLILHGTVCDALADADKHVPNVETVEPPTEVDSRPATVHPVGSDAKTTPIQSTIAAPDAGDKPGESTANDKADESSNLGGVGSPATLPTPNADRPLAEPEAASIATPTPASASNSDKSNTGASPAVVAAPAPIPTLNSNQPNMETSPAVVATPPPTASPAVVATPTPKANPDTSTTTPDVPAAAGLRSENSQSPAASDNQFEPSTTAIPAVAPSQNPVTDVSAAIDPDAQIAEQLHNLANGKFDGIIGAERAAVDAFYSGRNYAPLWVTDSKANARAKATIGYLNRVWADGLDPADYPVPNFDSSSDPVALAEAEIRLTKSVITYAHHAQIGRVHWSRVSGDIFYERNPPDPREILNTLVEAKDVAAALDAYEPHSAAYLALKAKLAEVRGGQLDANKSRNSKLNAHQSDQRTDIIIANMERWRWMPHDLGNTYVIVNLPDFTLRVIRQGKQLWMTKVVVGKPATPTPIITAQMKSITINPTWNVPDSIAYKEYVPLLQQDPTILQRMGLRVSYNADGTIHLSQPPGEQNALGQLRFNFPNKFLVYQHDSNQKYLFANERRAESHGCMRVQDPVKYAEVLLSMARPGEGYSQDRIHRMFGVNEIDIPFPSYIPVHLTYQTAFVDDRGNLEFREDMYGRDQALLAILKGTGRKVADIPIQRRDSPMRRQLLAMPDNRWGGWGGRGYYTGGRNFSTPLAPSAPVPRRSAPQSRVYYQ